MVDDVPISNPNEVAPVINNQLSQQVAKPGAGDDDAIMDEDIACNSIPITNFKSNNI